VKIALSIKATYRPDWGLWEGLREIIQNGHDGERQHGAKLSVLWRDGALHVINTGITLSPKALLLGETTKESCDNVIGRWGDGLKIGTLALVRLGCTVRVRTGDSTWSVAIEPAEQYGGEPVLTFTIRRTQPYPVNSIEVEVSGGSLNRATWLEMASRFRWLQPDGSLRTPPDPGRPNSDRAGVVSTRWGDLLLQEPGKIYVLGIYVETDSRLAYGYDFGRASGVQLDVDRKTVQWFDRQGAVRSILRDIISQQPEHAQRVIDTLYVSGGEAQVFDHYAGREIEPETRERLVSDWQSRYGTDAIPVASMEESQDAAHWGARGIVVPASVRTVLTACGLTLTERKTNGDNQVVRQMSWDDISATEQDTLLACLVLLGDDTLKLEQVDVVEFRDPKTLGLAKPSEGRVLVASKLLASRGDLATTLIHEAAHLVAGGAAGHGKSFEDVLESVWQRVLLKLWP